MRGPAVKRRAVYSPSTANIGLELGLQGSGTALTRRDASRGSSDTHDSHREHRTSTWGVEKADEANHKAGLETFVRRPRSNPVPPQGVLRHEALLGRDKVVRPGIAGRRGLAESATSPPRPATSEGERADVRLVARGDSGSSNRSLSPARLCRRDSSRTSVSSRGSSSSPSRASLMPRARVRGSLQPLSPTTVLPSAMAHRHSPLRPTSTHTHASTHKSRLATVAK